MAWQKACILLAVYLFSGTIGAATCCAEDLSRQQITIRAFQAWLQREQADRAAAAKAFRDTFESAKALSVRDRLARAANTSGELSALGKTASAERLARSGYVSSSRAAIYPSTSHVLRLLADRPWLRDMLEGNHSTYSLRVDTFELRWPTEQDADALRGLVHDQDPEIQAMAIEALSTLHDPADVSSFGSLLRLEAPAVSMLVTQSRQLGIAADPTPSVEVEEDKLCFEVHWQSGTVADYARKALQFMTGAEVTAQSFPTWLKKYRADRNSLWYWQQRLQREFDQLDQSLARLTEQDPLKGAAARSVQSAKLRESIRRELATLDPQVEARVLLLANHPYGGGTDITNPEQRFFDPPWQTRLSKAELLQLLAGEQPWSDVDWTNGSGDVREVYDRVVSRIMLSADRVFARDDVPRLQTLLDSPSHPLWWSGRTAWLIGISRLLPLAKPQELDNPNTRDGYLRQAIREQQDVSVQGFTAAELVKFGLPNNAPFLRDVFFAEREAQGYSELRGSILQALGQPPLTQEKRSLLLDLVSDKRTRPLLTQSSLRMGDDLYRIWAAQSINAHAGRELMTRMDLQDMRDQTKTNDVLDRVLKQFNELPPLNE